MRTMLVNTYWWAVPVTTPTVCKGAVLVCIYLIKDITNLQRALSQPATGNFLFTRF